MKIQLFLEHHGVARNPFAEEDAQTDLVFKEHCIASTFHPTWDKIYGDPNEPSTSVVFGEKGAGKTAMRLQIARHLQQHNRSCPDRRLFVVHYDDFNPFLDRFREKLGGRKSRRADRVLREWKLWDHMDAILSLATTGLIDRILNVHQPATFVDAEVESEAVDRLDRHQARDLLLLAACYDQSVSTTFRDRWSALRKRLRFSTLRAKVPFGIGIGGTVAVLALAVGLAVAGHGSWVMKLWMLFAAAVLAAWGPWLWRWWSCFWESRRILRQMRLSNRDSRTLRQVLLQFTRPEIVAPAAAGRGKHGRPLRNAAETPGRPADPGVPRHRGPGRSFGRAALDQRFGGTDEGPALADAGQQVPQASGAGAEDHGADRADAVHRA